MSCITFIRKLTRRLERERLSAQRAAEQAADAAEKLRLHRTAEVLRWVGFFRSERSTIIPARALEQGLWHAKVAAVRLGPVGFVGLPGEMFAEIGLQIKKRSPFETTVTVELANDWVGYVPTERAFEEGGYETELARSSKLTPQAEGMFVEAQMPAIG